VVSMAANFTCKLLAYTSIHSDTQNKQMWMQSQSTSVVKSSDIGMKLVLFVFLLTFLLGGCSTAGLSPKAKVTAITHVTVIDAVNGTRENQTVLFEQDQILAVSDEVDLSEVNTVIDGKGRFLIPGLWDFHVHLTYEADLIERMPQLLLSYGITSIRDTGGLLRKLLPVVETMRAPGAIAPRVYYSGPLLDGDYVVYDGVSRPEIGVRNSTPEDAQAMIAELKSLGVSFIKIYELVTPEVFTAMVDAANRLGLPIDSHVPLSMLASTAGPRVSSIEHLRNIELDCASNAEDLHVTRLAALQNPKGVSGYELRASLHKLQRIDAIKHFDEVRCQKTIQSLGKTLQVPTLRLNAMLAYPPFQRAGWDEAFSRLPDTVRESWGSLIEASGDQPPPDLTFSNWSLFLTGMLNEAGVPIGAGTDTPIGLSVPGFSLHSELEMLVQAGLTPMQVIESATLHPAEYFSLESSSGSIDVGKQADMLLLNANPLEDIRNTRDISAVISKGRIFDPLELTN
jgi:cytosine/adenosine deaminase-related metal-dependent hydrolase